MTRRAVAPLLALVLLFLILAGCESDRLLTEEPPGEGAINLAAIPVRLAQAAPSARHGCFVSLRRSDGNGYAARQLALYFSEEIVAEAGGETEQVAYRLYDAGGALLSTANCRIPASEAAAKVVHERLRYKATLGERTQVLAAAPAGVGDADMWCEAGRCWRERLLGAAGNGSVASKAKRNALGGLGLTSTAGECGDDGWGGGGGSSPPPDDGPPSNDDPDLPNTPGPPAIDPSPPPPSSGGGSSGGGDNSGDDEEETGPGHGGDPVLAGVTAEAGECECDGEEDCEPEDERPGTIPVGRFIKVIKKAIQYGNRGEDLLDVRTWKQIGREEWDGLLNCIGNLGDAVMGEPVLWPILDCAADLTIGLKGDDFIKGAKHLGILDDFIKTLRRSKHFGAFVNSIANLDVLYEVAKLDLYKYDKNGDAIYRITEGKARSVFDSIARGWRTGVTQLPGSRFQIRRGSEVITLYRATGGSNAWSFDVNRGGRSFKIRFGSY